MGFFKPSVAAVYEYQIGPCEQFEISKKVQTSEMKYVILGCFRLINQCNLKIVIEQSTQSFDVNADASKGWGNRPGDQYVWFVVHI